ncbi:Uma2 family endonuclease [Natronosporangium hydrolyticum]|uniref:Uma2 family endonuclease n=1 Tax=Natronosporangium hydrolyticum TaxID=2811111 RepID=A0A895YKH0_9ACTN|nr:Uma2 family endonuclease [Natronosporangium hydrolyticum]QSB15999.1 Uma2 family endonuclease [Natronosporangium hydrolyticum]
MPQHTTLSRQPLYPWPAPGGRFTVDDLADLPHDGHRCEIIEGGLRVAPPVEISHHVIADQVAMRLAAAAPAGWYPVREAGLGIGDSAVVPDVTVLRPGAPLTSVWADPSDVALVVEVEAAGSRRLDRFTKPALYAEAGIESYWRIEPTQAGPVTHLYTQASGGHYRQHRSINPGETAVVELPFQLQLAPASWLD